MRTKSLETKTYKNIIKDVICGSSHKDVKEDFRIELIVIMKQDMEGCVDFKVMIIGSNTNSNLTNHFLYHTVSKTTKLHTWLNMINIKCSWN